MNATDKVLEHSFETFYSLVRKKSSRKSRICLSCNTPFLSRGISNRICGNCSIQNNKKSARSQTTYVFHNTPQRNIESLY